MYRVALCDEIVNILSVCKSARSDPGGMKDFSLILVIISSFFFQADWPGGNYVEQYCSLLALLHILKMFTISSQSATRYITLLSIRSVKDLWQNQMS